MLKTLPAFAAAVLVTAALGCASSSSDDEEISDSAEAISASKPYDCTLQLVEEVPARQHTLKISPGHEDICSNDPDVGDAEIVDTLEFNPVPPGVETRCGGEAGTGANGTGEGKALLVFDSTTLDQKFKLTLDCDPSIPNACLSPLPGLGGRLGTVSVESADKSQKDLEFNRIEAAVVATIDKKEKTVRVSVNGNRNAIDFDLPEDRLIDGLSQGSANGLFSTKAPKIELSVRYAGRKIDGRILDQNVRLTCTK
jgi:hypothetical protein